MLLFKTAYTISVKQYKQYYKIEKFKNYALTVKYD